MRRTKIVCTIGPATGTTAAIGELITAGMDVARLNFAHGDYAEHGRFIQTLRQAASRTGKHLAILQDLPGPKDRTGRLKGGSLRLKDGAELVLTTRQIVGDDRRISVGLESLARDVRAGNTIFLNDGAIRLQVLATNGIDIKCRVLVGGELGENKGINVPGVMLSTPSVTKNDLEHLRFGIRQGVDLVALSFVRDAGEIRRVRDVMKRQGGRQLLIAKIEKSEALENIDSVIEAADGVMVARGDLGVEIDIERVPLVQKEIIRKCNRLGKPVVVATQMLESMVNSPRPTRAEVTDVANAIFDGADAVMLSQETAIGKYPAEAVATMSRIACETESALPYDDILEVRGRDQSPETDDAISYAACRIADQIGAAAIVAFTTSGTTVRRVSRYRPKAPVVAISSSEVVCRQLALSWGVQATVVPEANNLGELFSRGASIARKSGMAKKGDTVVITGGVPVGVPGSTNLVKVARVE
ncbi:MAG: pyruvate kinase [Chloroflexota bacterium]